MLFSIVIPVFNAEGSIARLVEAIESSKSNDYEIILVNDGSTDDSALVCENLACRYSNIHVIHQENAGAAAARNRGISEARAQYLLFFDSDDLVEDSVIDKLTNLLGDQEYDFIAFGYDVLDDRCTTSMGPLPFNGVVSSDELKSKLCFYAENNELNSVWNKVFCRDVIERFGIRFSDMRFGEDSVFVCDYIRCTDNNSLIVSDVLYHVIPNASSVTHLYYPNRFSDEMELISVLENTARRFSVADAEITRMLVIKRYAAILFELFNLGLTDCKMSFRDKRKYMSKIITQPIFQESIRDYGKYKQLTFKEKLWDILLKKQWTALAIFLSAFNAKRKGF